jgi:hypothetical protein
MLPPAPKDSMAYSTLLSAKEMREGREKRQNALDHPLFMSRGSGAILALRPRPQIHTPHKVKTLEAYPILPRPRGLHPVGAFARTPEKSSTKASRGPGNNLAKAWQRANPTYSL